MRATLVNKVRDRILLIIWGLIHGGIGTYWVLLGIAFAFPGTTPDSKDYEEDMMFVPAGWFMIVMWAALTILTVVLSRKDKGKLLSFLLPLVIGIGSCVGFMYFLGQHF